jgi:hypothetical protein
VALATHAYLITRKGAEKLSSFMDKNITSPVDNRIYELHCEKQINLYCLINRLVHQTSTDTGSGSQTTSYPIILKKLASMVEVEKMVRLDYILSMSIVRIGDFKVNYTTLLFIFFGIICALNNVSISTITIIFVLLSSADFFCIKNYCNMIIYYIILIFPSIIRRL